MWLSILAAAMMLHPTYDNHGSYCGSSAQEFAVWSSVCEDADGHPVQDTDGVWECIDDDTDGGEPVVVDLNR